MRSVSRWLTTSGASTSRRWGGRIAACALLGSLQWLGDTIVDRTGWPVSGSLIGMLLLLAMLIVRGRVPASIEAVSAPLLRHLMLLLIPSVAAVSVHGALVTRSGVVFVGVSTVVTALTVLATAWTLHRLMRRARQ